MRINGVSEFNGWTITTNIKRDGRHTFDVLGYVNAIRREYPGATILTNDVTADHYGASAAVTACPAKPINKRIARFVGIDATTTAQGFWA